MPQISQIQFASPLALAPIAGHTHLPFRRLVRRCGGLGFAVTELISAQAIVRNAKSADRIAATTPDDQPLAMQLHGGDPKIMCQAAEQLIAQGARWIDINMGCPAPKVTGKRAGAALLDDPRLACAIADQLVRHCRPIPVTAKLRLGMHTGQLTAPHLAQRLADLGIAAIALHGRYAQQNYAGQCDRRAIAHVFESVKRRHPQLTCIANGDIRTPQHARTMLQQTPADMIMIGRAALGAPWIFADTCNYLQTGQLTDSFTLEDRLNVISQHYQLMAEQFTPQKALADMNQQIAAYGKHLGHIQPLKNTLRTMTEPEQFVPAIRQFLADNPQLAHAIPVTWAQRRQALDRSRHRNSGQPND